MNFSISIGEIDRTSPMLSKPYPWLSTGKSSAGRSDTPKKSRIVLLNSTRFNRRAVTRPGPELITGLGRVSIHPTTASTSAALNPGKGAGGICLAETRPRTFCQTSGFTVPARFSPATWLFSPWH